jgi:hypothetical protein
MTKDDRARLGTQVGRIDENGRLASSLLVAGVVANALIVGRALWVNRFRYNQMAFGLFYAWWKRFTAGIDPWRARPHCNFPPAFVIWFAPLSRLPQSLAFWLWQIGQAMAFFGAIFLIVREAGPLSRLRLTAILALVALLLPYFLTSAIYEAEPTALLLLLLIAAWSLARRDRPRWAGFLLAAATVLKIYPVVMGGYFWFRRRDVAVWGAVFTIAMVVITGPQHWFDSAVHGVSPYFKSLAWLANGRALNILFNVYAVLAKLPIVGGAQIVWLLLISTVLDLTIIATAIAVTWRATDHLDGVELDGMVFTLWAMAMLLVSPLAWVHEITFVLPLYLFVAIYAGRRDAALPIGAPILLGVALAAHAAAYYWTPVRNGHADFVAMLCEFGAGCVVCHARRDIVAPTARDHEAISEVGGLPYS